MKTDSKQPVMRSVSSVEEINVTTVVGVCTSLKPAPGIEGSSATRSVLKYSLDAVSAIYPNTYLLDLRDYKLPFFDGRMPHEYQSTDLDIVRSCVDQAGALLLSVAAYWNGVSGVFKNFVELLCGPAYDLDGDLQTVFTNKPVGLVIVGADLASTEAGAVQARQIMSSTGAVIVAEPLAIANPRAGNLDVQLLSSELVVLGAQLAQHTLRPKK